MTIGSGDFELTMDELRVVAHYALESAEGVLPVFEDANPGDPRPRAAINAAREFVNGAKRTKLQRITSLTPTGRQRRRPRKPHGSLHAPPEMPPLRPTSIRSRKPPKSVTS